MRYFRYFQNIYTCVCVCVCVLPSLSNRGLSGAETPKRPKTICPSEDKICVLAFLHWICISCVSLITPITSPRIGKVCVCVHCAGTVCLSKKCFSNTHTHTDLEAGLKSLALCAPPTVPG